jgi:hypothetical protein
MGLFNFFKTPAPKVPQSDEMEWIQVASKIASTIWHLLQNDPKMIASPFARILLRDDWNVGVANTQCDPEKILGKHDVAFVILREDQAAYEKWVEGLKTGSPTFQQIETEQFAKALTRKLHERVEVID